jgi:uncharacterized membrane protein YfcA
MPAGRRYFPLLMSAAEIAFVFVWTFAVAVAGGVAGLVLGNLRLPVIVSVSSSPAAGAGANVAVSAIGALTASIAHWRGGRIDWRLFWWLAPPSLIGGIAGGLISGVLPDQVLLGAISLVVLYGAVEVRRVAHRERPAPRPGAHFNPWGAVTIGFAVGVLGGLVGLILGTLRLPAMVRWLGTGPKASVGTNAATGVVVGIGGLIGHVAGGVDWAALGVGAAAVIPGATVGARLTGRLDDRALLQVISWILVVAGLSLAAQAIIG